MVVEHVEKPPEFIDALWRVLRPGGRVVVFTVNKTSPITLVSRTLPFALHYPIKRFLWGGNEEDTFPVRYRMNTKHILGELFRRQGFSELAFAYLDDLSTFNQFRCLGRLELFVWRLCQEAGLKYPENCLLGVYEKPT